MAHIAPKYSVDERDAMGIGMVDRGMSAQEVRTAAQAGLLERSDGTRLPPFDPPVASIRHYARAVKKRRAGKARSEADKLPPRDAVESVRVRLIRMLDLELAVEERKRNGKRDIERIRQLARAAREAAALPEINDPRPPSPASRAGGASPTTGGLGGQILKAHGAARVSTPAHGVQTEKRSTESAHVQGAARSEHQHAHIEQGGGEHGEQESEHIGTVLGPVLGGGQG